jgi:hypothetical protein
MEGRVGQTKACDYFMHCPKYRVAICRTCHFAVFPDQARTHLSTRHSGLCAKERRQILNDLLSWPDVSLSNDDSFKPPCTVDEPVVGLQLFCDGLQCIVDPSRCTYICRSRDVLKNHWRKAHSWNRDEGGRGGLQNAERSRKVQQREADACRPVYCQRLHPKNRYASYFAVTQILAADGSGELQEQQQGALANTLTSTVLDNLAVLKQRQSQHGLVVPQASSAKEVSPWLQMTR